MAAPKRPNPPGAKSEKEWRDAVRIAVHALREDPDSGERIKALRLIAERVVTLACAGTEWAVLEIGNRLDGRSPQSSEITVKRDANDLSEAELLAIALTAQFPSAHDANTSSIN